VQTPDIALLSALIFAAAIIYSSVGHAGASGYIAAMALFGLTPAVMKPTALTLNILVATLATYRWAGNGLVSWRVLLPLAATSVPFAFIGGAMQIPAHWYRLLIGIILLTAAAKLFFQPRETAGGTATPARIPTVPGTITGGIVGFLSGLTGTGGGIFLSPLLLFFGWAGPRQASGITVPFILINSIAGLAGNIYALRSLPNELPFFMIAAVLGALVGTQMGIHWVSQRTLQRVLAVVLFIAAIKFIFV
jgi:uncharacterized protein